MKSFLLLATLCLLTLRASSQGVEPLAPVVVRLLKGDVAAREYVAMDTASYRVTRQLVAQVQPLRQRLALLEYDRELLQKQVADGRQANRLANDDFAACQAQARQLAAVPRRPPLFLDSRLYLGALGGVILGEVAHILLFRSL